MQMPLDEEIAEEEEIQYCGIVQKQIQMENSQEYEKNGNEMASMKVNAGNDESSSTTGKSGTNELENRKEGQRKNCTEEQMEDEGEWLQKDDGMEWEGNGEDPFPIINIQQQKTTKKITVSSPYPLSDCAIVSRNCAEQNNQKMAPTTNQQQQNKQLKQIENQTTKDNKTICVSGIDGSLTNPDFLLSHFSKCGQIFQISILNRPAQGDPDWGFAKITFNEKQSAARAILEMNGTRLKLGMLKCQWWTKNKETKIKEIVQQMQKEKALEMGKKAEGKAKNVPLICLSSPSTTSASGTFSIGSSESGEEVEIVGEYMQHRKGEFFLPKTKRWIPDKLPGWSPSASDEEKMHGGGKVWELAESLKQKGSQLATADRMRIMMTLLEGVEFETKALQQNLLFSKSESEASSSGSEKNQ